MRAAIIASVVVHVALLIWAPWRDQNEQRDWRLIPTEPVPAPPSQPVELEYIGFVELPNDVRIAAIDPATLTAKSREPAIATGKATPRDHSRSEQGHSQLTERNPRKLAMRKPEPVKLAMPQGFIDDLLNKPYTPPEIPDLPGARIDAEIAAIQERRRNPPPGYSYSDDIESLVALREEKKAVELKKQKDGSYESEKTTYIAKVRVDGTVDLVDKPNIQREGLGARFDVSDAIMRAVGQDPYASEKRRFLDRTRDQRVAIGNEHKKATYQRSRQYATSAVLRAWNSAPDLAAKKRVLFELWDECAETGRADLVAGAADARAAIENFIQWKLVGPDAYTAEELRAFNAKRSSKAVFAPYAE